MKSRTTSALRAAAASTAPGVDTALLEQLFDHTPDIAFFIKDATGRYVAVNRSFAQSLGLTPETAVGKKTSELAGPDAASMYLVAGVVTWSAHGCPHKIRCPLVAAWPARRKSHRGFI